MANRPPAPVKTGPLSKAERAELLALCLMMKAEVDALLQRMPDATVALVSGTVLGVSQELSCSAAKKSIPRTSGALTLPKNDTRLGTLRFLPYIATLLTRSGCALSKADQTALSCPASFALKAQVSGAQNLELHEVVGKHLQDLLREGIAYIAGGSTGRRTAIDQATEAIISAVVRQMRHVLSGRPGARVAARPRSLNRFGIKPHDKQKRGRFRIGTGQVVSRNKLYEALKIADARGLISKHGIQERDFTYDLTPVGFAAAETASFLSKLRLETMHRTVTLRVSSSGRIWCSAPATRDRRARKWVDAVSTLTDMNHETAARAPAASSAMRKKKKKKKKKQKDRMA